MKKGFFLSISAVLILAVIVIFLQIGKTNKAQQSQLDSAYLKDKLSTDYADDAAHVYLPALLAFSGKYALGNCSHIIPADIAGDMTILMQGGTVSGETMLTQHQLRPALDMTLAAINTGVTVEWLNFTVLSLSQTDPWTIEMMTEVNITLRSGDIRWSDRNVYSTMLDVNGLYDPILLEPIQREVYGINSSRPCFLNLISGIGCGSIDGISPLP